jgi:hypothetical protein
MIKVINGKRYNTETSELLAEYENGLYGGDFGRLSEDLYRTKNGAFFLHGSGGAITVYSKSYGGNRMGGERIVPMTDEEVLGWLENRDIDIDNAAWKYFEIEDA